MKGAAVRFPAQRHAAPICAQCHAPMRLVRIERRPFHARTDKFVCRQCGLVDELVYCRSPALPLQVA